MIAPGTYSAVTTPAAASQRIHGGRCAVQHARSTKASTTSPALAFRSHRTCHHAIARSPVATSVVDRSGMGLLRRRIASVAIAAIRGNASTIVAWTVVRVSRVCSRAHNGWNSRMKSLCRCAMNGSARVITRAPKAAITTGAARRAIAGHASPSGRAHRCGAGRSHRSPRPPTSSAPPHHASE